MSDVFQIALSVLLMICFQAVAACCFYCGRHYALQIVQRSVKYPGGDVASMLTGVLLLAILFGQDEVLPMAIVASILALFLGIYYVSFGIDLAERTLRHVMASEAARASTIDVAQWPLSVGVEQ